MVMALIMFFGLFFFFSLHLSVLQGNCSIYMVLICIVKLFLNAPGARVIWCVRREVVISRYPNCMLVP